MDCPKARETWGKLDEAMNLLQMTLTSPQTIENMLGAGERLDKLNLTLQAELLLKLSTKSEGYCPEQMVKSSIALVFNSERLSEDKKLLYKNWKRG